MNRLTTLQSSVSKFLSRSFKPITISTTVKEWKKLNYENKLFTTSFTPKDITLWSKDLNYYSGIIFSSPYFTQYEVNGVVAQPAPFIASIIGGNDFCKFVYPLNFHTKNDNEVVSFNTEGFIPNRWIRMLHDFYFTESTINENEKDNSSYWNNQVKKIPDDVLLSLLNISKQMVDKRMTLTVNKAPSYTIEEAKGITFYNKYREENKAFENDIVNRVWFTDDGCVSPSVRIFMERCKHYKSYYGGTYGLLYKCEGGLEMRYHPNIPWFDIVGSISYGSIYQELVGNNSYHSSLKRVPIEELIVLEEALKKEGADITVTF